MCCFKRLAGRLESTLGLHSEGALRRAGIVDHRGVRERVEFDNSATLDAALIAATPGRTCK